MHAPVAHLLPPLQAALALSSSGSGLPPPHDFTFFCEPRHDEPPPPTAADQAASQQQAQQQAQQQQQGGGGGGGPAGLAQAGTSGGAGAGALALAGASCGSSSGEGLVSKWRQKERLKTTAVALVMCLNIGARPAARALHAAVLRSHAKLPGLGAPRRALTRPPRWAPLRPAHPTPRQAWTRPTSSRSAPARGSSAGWTRCPCRRPRRWTP